MPVTISQSFQIMYQNYNYFTFLVAKLYNSFEVVRTSASCKQANTQVYLDPINFRILSSRTFLHASSMRGKNPRTSICVDAKKSPNDGPRQ